MIEGVRFRHALRCATGGAIITALAQTRLTSGCLSSILFYISTVAGTPEPYHGFQLRSIVLTLLGVFCAAATSCAILYASSSSLAAFFLSLPFIVFFTALRPERQLLPMPIICNIFVGYSVISNVNMDRAKLPLVTKAFLTDGFIAFAVALVVNLIFPDYAGTLGRALLACELKRAGSGLSSAASEIFADSTNPSISGRQHPPSCENSTENVEEVTIEPHVESVRSFKTLGGSMKRSMVAGVSSFHKLLSNLDVSSESHRIIPPGYSRAATYGSIARAQQLLTLSIYEPTGLGLRYAFRCNDVAKWEALLDSTRDLVTKISSLESVVGNSTSSEQNRVFSRDHVKFLLGEAYLPLWMSHFAASAAACNVACNHLSNQYLINAEHGFDCQIDARTKSWAFRRVELYHGFLMQYRSYWRVHGSPTEYGVCSIDGSTKDKAHQNAGTDAASSKFANFALRGAELRAIIFFSVSSHALSENLAKMQSALDDIAKMISVSSVLQPIRFLSLPLLSIAQRVSYLCRGRVAPWEARFVLAHSLMLSTILAVALFVKPLHKLESTEIGWVYTSAVLAAQLSAEPTVFIGALRVLSTLFGSFCGFVVNEVLRATNKSQAFYALVPYMSIVTMVSLLLIPPEYRYAAFLLIVTNGIVSFCPRSTERCTVAFELLPSSCFADWRYAVSRSVNVSIGVVFALVFHLLFWPRYAQSDARNQLSIAIKNGSRLFSLFHRRYFEYGSDAKEECRLNITSLADESLDDRFSTIAGTATSEHRRLMRSIFSQNVMSNCDELNDRVREQIGSYISCAMLLISTDASAWPGSSGRLALAPLLRDLPSHFISLQVSLAEMASILGRRPIYEGRYSRSVHRRYINPLVFEYETLLVYAIRASSLFRHRSLHNLVSVTEESLSLREQTGNADDLLDSVIGGIRHLTLTVRYLQTRVASLRRAAHSMRERVHESTASSLALSNNLYVKPSISADDILAVSRKNADKPHVRQRSLGAENIQQNRMLLRVDDVVLYNAFSFAADACVAAFTSIADVVKNDMQLKQEARRTREKAKSN